MSYSIYYGSDKPEPVPNKRSRFGLIGAMVVIMVCAMVIGWSIPQQVEQFARVLLPWTRNEVRAAFVEFREDIKDGLPLSDAVTAFCLEIIRDAEQSQ